MPLGCAGGRARVLRGARWGVGCGKDVPMGTDEGWEASVAERTKIMLDESEIPRQWYNVIPDLPSPPPPPLHPGTLQPVGPEDLAPLFPMELIRQEVATHSLIDVSAAVLNAD